MVFVFGQSVKLSYANTKSRQNVSSFGYGEGPIVNRDGYRRSFSTLSTHHVSSEFCLLSGERADRSILLSLRMSKLTLVARSHWHAHVAGTFCAPTRGALGVGGDLL